MLLAPLRLAFRILRLLVVAAVVYYAVTLVQVVLTSRQDDPHRAGAALVFGTAAGCKAPGSDLQARLNRALGLFRAHDVALIAVTGGKLPTDCETEAQVSATYLERNGVPKADVVVGNGSDTWQNVASVAPALRSHGVRTVLVVTDPFHEYRAMAIASDFGFAPSATPSQHSPIGGGGLVLHYLKEAGEVALARIVGYSTLSGWFHG